MNSKLFPSLALATVFSAISSTAGFAQTNANTVLTPPAIVQKCLATYAALSSYSDSGKTVESDFNGSAKTNTFHIRMQRPNLFRVTWVQTDGNVTNTGLWRSAVTDGFSKDDSVVMTTSGQPTNAGPVYEWIPFALTDLALKAGDVTLLPDIFFHFRPGNILEKNYSGHFEVTLTHENIDTNACYLIALNQGARITNTPTVWVTRLWIGKRDFLLHQVQSSITDIKLGERKITQTHEQIDVNRKYTVEDFEPKAPSNSVSITLHSAPPATFFHSESKPDEPDITVMSAKFGAGKNEADVTMRVAELLRDQPEGFVVNAQSLGVDPLPGKKKRLVVKYDFQGDFRTLIIPSGKRLSRQRLVHDSEE